MTQERYERIDTKFWIIDPELGISLEGDSDSLECSYYPSGALRSESSYRLKGLHGPSIYYDKSGQVLSKTWFYNGKKMGKAQRFFITGRLYSQERFVDGLPHLAQEYFHSDGSLKTAIHYDHGALHGETILYWPDGILKRKCSFILGKKELDTFYDEGGNLIEAIQPAIS